MSRLLPIVAATAVLASLFAAAARAGGDAPGELLARYQPVLVLDSTERFAPTAVDSFVEGSDLERLGDGGYAVADGRRRGLPERGEGWRLNERGCDPAGGLASLSCYAAGDPASRLVYGRFEKVKGGSVLQYWLFY